jgi:hypothetical protein
MSNTKLEELKSLIVKLQADRQGHLDAIAHIDEAFEALGIKAPMMKRSRAHGTPVKAAGRRRRRKFKVTGGDSILAFVKAAGAKGVSGGQIVRNWKAEGRGAGCYNMLGTLVRGKKIKRQHAKGGRGSVYTV